MVTKSRVFWTIFWIVIIIFVLNNPHKLADWIDTIIGKVEDFFNGIVTIIDDL